ncbi:MAG: ABC transporter ATP-binding protein [Sphingobacteriia bacterium]|nr:ABC transporter ATP-binding protein [Sphingobacteriia bacterium]
MDRLPSTTFKFIWYFLKDYKLYLYGNLFCSIISSLIPPLDSYIIKYLIDFVTNNSINNKLLIICSIAFIIRSECYNIFYRAWEYIQVNTVPEMRMEIIRKLTDYITNHSYKYFQENFAGSISNKISDLYRAVPSVFSSFSATLEKIAHGIFSILFLATVNGKLGMVMLIYFIVFIVANFYFLKPIDNYSQIVAKNRSTMWGKVIDIIRNINNVIYFANKIHEINYLSSYLQKTTDSDKKFRLYIIKSNYIKGFINNIMIGFIVYFTIKLYAEKQLTYGDFYLIFSITINIIQLTWNFLDDLNKFTEEIGTLKQGITLVTKEHEIKDKVNAFELKVLNGDICFNNVHFKYLHDKPLFENLSVTIEGNTKVGLVGYSGSGKTTFVNLIIRLFDIQNGKISIDNQDVNLVTQDSLRKNIAFIPQDPILFHRSLMENIRYGNINTSDEEVIEAAKLASAYDFIMKTEEGFNSLVGERGVKLSGGQRQRIAIARAILKNAPILILDEATSSLDSITEKDIQNSLENLMKNRTTIVIAHRLSTLLNMDRILVFDKGKIIEDGTHYDLLNKNSLYTKLWNSQINGFINDSDTQENI